MSPIYIHEKWWQEPLRKDNLMQSFKLCNKYYHTECNNFQHIFCTLNYFLKYFLKILLKKILKLF